MKLSKEAACKVEIRNACTEVRCPHGTELARGIHCFISYSHEDIDIARRLKQALEKCGFRVWMDEGDIPPGEEWDELILENIRQAAAVLYLVSPTSRTSPNVKHEIAYANAFKKSIQFLWIGGNDKWVKTVMFGYSHRQYIDMREEKYEKGINDLYPILNNLLDSTPCLQEQNQKKKKEYPTQQKRPKIQRYLPIRIITLLILSFVLKPLNWNADPTIVTSLADTGLGTLPYALQHANDGATITFAPNLTGETITLTHTDLDINKSITLRGPAAGIRLTSGSTGHHIQIDPGRNVTIENMIFTNSYTLKHSMIENAGNLTINNSTMSRNKSYASHGGGAIYNTGVLVLNSDLFKENTVNSNGGAIYNFFGNTTINNSIIMNNEAYYNGGGMYSLGGNIFISNSSILNNNSDNNAGGGIFMINGSLTISNTEIKENHSDYKSDKGVGGGIGGGIAIVGSVASINSSVITANTASGKGGGIVVTKDVNNDAPSRVILQDILQTNNPRAVLYIEQNTGGDIAGIVTTTGTTHQISDDTSIYNLGDPPGRYLPQKSPNYLGIVNVNAFCIANGGSYGQISKHVDPNAKDIMFICFNQSNQAVGTDFSGQTICQYQYPTSPGVNTVIDRIANYYDPTSLQCYKNLKLLGPIVGQTGFARYCASQPQYTGLFDNFQYRTTAYDWLCQPKDQSKLPNGLAVADACNLQYGVKDAIDRLANYNNVDGWECWEPA